METIRELLQPETDPTLTVDDLPSSLENLRDPGFFKLMQSFLRTMKDPEELAKFEQDMKSLESMTISRGVQGQVEGGLTKQMKVEKKVPVLPVEHIVAEKWFCLIGTALYYEDYQQKQVEIFINFSWSERIADAKSELVCSHGHDHEHHSFEGLPETGTHVEGHHHYQIPYVLDRMFMSVKMKIFDFAVGRKTMRWARQQADFHAAMVRSATEAIQEEYGDQILFESLSLVPETNYKWPPETITQRMPSQEVETIPSLLPSLESKLNTTYGSANVPQRRTKLTEQQRDMIFKQLTISPIPAHIFVETSTPPAKHDTLKISIPEATYRQNDRFITIKVAFPNHGVNCSSIHWELSTTPAISDRNTSIEAGSSEVVSAEGQLTLEKHRLDLTFLDLKLGSYALHIPLYSRVVSQQSYATASTTDFIIVLRKEQSNNAWKSPFDLDSRS